MNVWRHQDRIPMVTVLHGGRVFTCSRFVCVCVCVIWQWKREKERKRHTMRVLLLAARFNRGGRKCPRNTHFIRMHWQTHCMGQVDTSNRGTKGSRWALYVIALCNGLKKINTTSRGKNLVRWWKIKSKIYDWWEYSRNKFNTLLSDYQASHERHAVILFHKVAKKMFHNHSWRYAI